jgi:hypothetical protein
VSKFRIEPTVERHESNGAAMQLITVDIVLVQEVRVGRDSAEAAVVDPRIAGRSGDDLALVFARMTLGHALVHREPRLSGSLWREGDIAWLPGTHGVGRGDSVTSLLSPLEIDVLRES